MSVPTNVQNLVEKICSYFFRIAKGKFYAYAKSWANRTRNWAKLHCNQLIAVLVMLQKQIHIDSAKPVFRNHSFFRKIL